MIRCGQSFRASPMLSGMKVLTADPSCLASVEVSFAVSFAVALLALVPGLLFALMVWPTPLCVAPPFTLDFTNYEGIVIAHPGR
jgi:hypothetical protein